MPPKLPIEKPEKFKLGHYRGVRLLSVGEFFCYATFPLKLNWRQLMDRWGTEPFEDLRPSPVDVFSELHHYTTLIGMEGILSSNSLWATSYHFLNDSTEIVHIASYLEAALAPELDRYLRKARKSLVPLDLAIAKYGGPRTFSRMLAHSFVGRHYDSLFRGLGPSGKIHCEPFIVSFCTHHGDAEYERNNGLLSQWRSYGAQEGVAIVFDTARLVKWLSGEQERYDYLLLSLNEVFYNEGAQLFLKQFPVLIPTILRLGLNFVSTGFSDVASTGDIARLHDLALDGIPEFAANICRFKHRGFREEREIRIVACPILTDGPIRGRQLRKKQIMERGPRGVRYIALESAGNSSLKQAMTRVIVGPAENQKELARKVGEAVGSEIQIVCSETPLLR